MQHKSSKLFFFCVLFLNYSRFEGLAADQASLISFESGMLANRNFTLSCLNDPFWSLLKQKYDFFISKDCGRLRDPIIPKIVHHIWLGSPLPEQYNEFRNTWIRQNPGWSFMLWTDKEMEDFPLQNRALYNGAKNYGQKSDIARYEILYRYGGLYVDTDFVCVKSFDEFNYRADFYAGIAHNSKVEIFNGLIGAVPGHPILKECIDAMGKYKSLNTGTLAILDETGPFHFTRCVLKHLLSSTRAVIFPTLYFYPFFPTEQSPKDYMIHADNEACYAIHLYHCSWMSK